MCKLKIVFIWIPLDLFIKFSMRLFRPFYDCSHPGKKTFFMSRWIFWALIFMPLWNAYFQSHISQRRSRWFVGFCKQFNFDKYSDKIPALYRLFWTDCSDYLWIFVNIKKKTLRPRIDDQTKRWGFQCGFTIVMLTI